MKNQTEVALSQVMFKAERGTMWLIAEVVEKVEGGYILTCGSTREFFVAQKNIKEVAA